MRLHGCKCRVIARPIALVSILSALACADKLRHVSALPARQVTLENRIDTEQFPEPLYDVFGMVPWGDSSFVVVDRDRFHAVASPSGTVRASFGRKGRGPGEFGSLSWVATLPGDSIVAYDNTWERFTWVTPDFRLARTARHTRTTDTEFIDPLCLLASGELVARVTPRRRIAPPPGLWEERGKVRVYAPDRGSFVDSGEMTFSSRWTGVMPGPAGPVRLALAPPFAPFAVVRCTRNGVIWGDGTSPILHRYESGRTVDIILTGLSADQVTRADRTHWRDSVWHGLGDAKRYTTESALHSFMDDARRAQTFETMPAYRDVRIADDGGLWVLMPRLEGDTAKVWRVHDSAGHFKDATQTPASFQLRVVLAQRLWGVAHDTNDVAEIRSYLRR